jgi:hypothetical protein
MAEAYMRASGTAIREMPISERTPPQTGSITGRAVAKDEAHHRVCDCREQLFRRRGDTAGSRRTNRRATVSALS